MGAFHLGVSLRRRTQQKRPRWLALKWHATVYQRIEGQKTKAVHAMSP